MDLCGPFLLSGECHPTESAGGFHARPTQHPRNYGQSVTKCRDSTCDLVGAAGVGLILANWAPGRASCPIPDKGDEEGTGIWSPRPPQNDREHGPFLSASHSRPGICSCPLKDHHLRDFVATSFSQCAAENKRERQDSSLAGPVPHLTKRLSALLSLLRHRHQMRGRGAGTGLGVHTRDVLIHSAGGGGSETHPPRL